MTLPEQADRAVSQTREFLVRLASPYGEGAIKGIRREVRAEALALLRHYPFSWNGDCPNQDNAANADNAEVRRLKGAITALADQDATLSVQDGNVIVTMDATLTDEERDSLKFAINQMKYIRADSAAATLRALLERTE
jgi:hypothetical protein